MYAPKSHAGLSPVVVFFYGGNWSTGERADYAFVGHALASRGYVLEVGNVVMEDKAQSLLNNASVREAYLGG